MDVKIWKPIKTPSKYNGKELFIGSVTDPYQPIEEKYGRIRVITALTLVMPGKIGKIKQVVRMPA